MVAARIIGRPFRGAYSSRLFKPSIIRTMATKGSVDWNATQYLKFANERTRPARDLLAQVHLESPTSIIDLGCGPGNSTELLASKYPSSKLMGMDSSPNMLQKAAAALPGVEFVQGDLRTYVPDRPVDLLFSNAVFQWLSKEERVPTIQRLLKTLPVGGVFALQVPDNFNEPSHVAMRETAADGPWKTVLDGLNLARDPFQSPSMLYDDFKPLCSNVDIWHTYYQHRLENHEAIIDWLMSTGLKPFIDPLDEVQRKGFLEAYLERIRKTYPTLIDGGVLLRFPRLFMVFTRG